MDCQPLASALACGDTVAGDTLGGPALIDAYACSGALDWTGPEAYYTVDITAPTNLRATLSGLASDLDVNQYTIDDPATFTRPFGVVIPMRRSDQPIFEYACHEGNYGMRNMLAGARAAEAGGTASR